MHIDVVKTHLIAINQGEIGLSERLHIILEHIFELYALDKGITWKHRQMQLKGNTRQTKWTPFKMEFSLVERAKMLFQNMEPDVLYYPDDTTFPLVDLYYKDKDGKCLAFKTPWQRNMPRMCHYIKVFMMKLVLVQGLCDCSCITWSCLAILITSVSRIFPQVNSGIMSNQKIGYNGRKIFHSWLLSHPLILRQKILKWVHLTIPLFGRTKL